MLKKITLSIAALTLITSTTLAFSQGKKQNIQAQLIQKLQLTPEQQIAMQKNSKQNRQTMRTNKQQQKQLNNELHQLNPSDPLFQKKVDEISDKAGNLAASLTAMRIQSQARFLSLLTPEQIKKLQELRATKKQGKKHLLQNN